MSLGSTLFQGFVKTGFAAGRLSDRIAANQADDGNHQATTTVSHQYFPEPDESYHREDSMPSYGGAPSDPLTAHWASGGYDEEG